MFFLFVAILCQFLFIKPSSANYCGIGLGIFWDNNSKCLLSSNSGLANCCFECTRSDGKFYCGSLLQLGSLTCSDATVVNQATQLCNGSGFECQCNPGSDPTQLDLFATLYTPTRQPTVPTNTTINTPNTPSNGLILTISLLFTVTFYGFIIL